MSPTKASPTTDDRPGTGKIVVTHPATGERVREYDVHSESEVRRRLDQAAQAFTTWRRTDLAARAGVLTAVADLLRASKGELAGGITDEMGKPIVQSEAEIEKCAWVCDYYATHAASFLAEQPRDVGDPRCHVRLDPLGVILAVMPWNFPFWQVFQIGRAHV